jgi:hypothetical protein
MRMERKMTVSVYKMKQNVTGVRAASSPKSTRQSLGTGIVVPKEPFLRFKDSWSLRLHTENETAMRLDAAVRGFLRRESAARK